MVKHFASGVRILIWLTLLMFLYAVIWLQGGTRDIGWAKPWLLETLNPPGAPYQITFDDVLLSWEDIRTFGDLRVRNMRFTRKDGGVFASIPQVSLSLDPLGFLPYRPGIHGIKLERPRLSLIRDEQGQLRFEVEGVEETIAVAEIAAFFASDDKQSEQTRRRMPFRRMQLSNASFLFADQATGGVLQSDALSFDIGRDGRNLHGGITMPFTWRDKPGSLDAGLSTQAVTGQRALNARLENVPAELICLFAGCPADIQFDGPLTGKLNLKKMPRQDISGGSFNLSTEKATLTAPKIFAESLHFKKGSLAGSASNQFTNIVFDAGAFAFPDTTIKLEDIVLSKKPEGWYAQGTASASHLAIEKLYKYWPLPMAPDSRKWVTTKLTVGHANSGTLAFNLEPKDLEGDVMRAEAIDGRVIARNLSVDYLEGFPKVTNADGTVYFTGKVITADIDTARLLTGTVVKPSKVVFTNLDVPATPMTTDLNLVAPARDVATMLRLKPFTFDDGINLDPERISGTAEANIKLGFDAFSEDAPGSADELDLSGIDYDISGTLSDIAQPELIDGRDIAGFSGTIKANQQGAELAGGVRLEGTDMNILLTDGAGDSDTTLTVKGTLARSQFASFGLPDLEQVGDGSVALDADIALGKDNTILKRADMDLTNVPLSIEEISWSKPAGTPARLLITPGAAPRHYGMVFTAPDISVENATLTLSETEDDIAAASIGRLKTATSDLSLTYAAKPVEGYTIGLRGAALDLSSAYNEEPVPKEQVDEQKAVEQPLENSLLADFPALDLDVDLAQLILVKGQPLENVKGMLRCDAARCTSADITAKTGKGDLTASITPVNGVRQLSITNSDAGDFLRALDISDRVFGGRIQLKGTYDDTKNPAPMEGRLLMHDFKLKNSEILARLISIGSLSGLANLLTGAGIDFDKFGADIGARGGVVNVTDGLADSTALGITVEGTVNTNSSNLDLKGVMVPANLLNSLIADLPLIGALAGGEGEGLIAFNYSVKGPFADPDVMVNPLSGLTPGFLRGIFRAGDKKVEKVPTLPGEEKPASDAQVPQQPVPWPGEKENP